MGIKFFRKNKIDLSQPNVSITVTDSVATNTGQSFADLLRNRSNNNGWQTTGSTDAAGTVIIVDMTDELPIDSIFLVNMNLKAYTIKYWNGSAYTDFSTPVAETVNATTTKLHQFTSVSTSLIKITITATMTVDDDKSMAQLIFTEALGTFTVEPVVSRPRISRNRKISTSLSGRKKVFKSIDAFSCNLRHDTVKLDADCDTIELLFNLYNPFLVWLCGGSVNQFSYERQGFRLQDIYYVDIVNDYEPEWIQGNYNAKIKLDMDIAEAL